MKQFTYSLDQLDTILQQHIIPLLNHPSILLFTGPLGAGKTTLIKELLSSYTLAEPITSPTFTYVNLYHDISGITFHHFDLYRLLSLEEFIAAGFHELLLDETSHSFVEWPSILIPFLHEHRTSKKIYALSLEYHHQDTSLRTLSLTPL